MRLDPYAFKQFEFGTGISISSSHVYSLLFILGQIVFRVSLNKSLLLIPCLAAP